MHNGVLSDPLEASEVAAKLKNYAKMIPSSLYYLGKKEIRVNKNAGVFARFALPAF